MKIRRAMKKDLGEIVSIFMIGSKKKPYSYKFTKKKVIDTFKPALKKKEMWVAVIDEKIVGFIWGGVSSVSKKIVYIDKLWVMEKYQGRGVGKSLLGFIEKYYKKKGVKIMRFTAYRKSKAPRFYKKLNYKVSKEVVLLEKKL